MGLGSDHALLNHTITTTTTAATATRGPDITVSGSTDSALVGSVDSLHGTVSVSLLDHRHLLLQRLLLLLKNCLLLLLLLLLLRLSSLLL